MAEGADGVSLGERVCLALIAEQPCHGWALVRALSPDSAIGRVWSLSRPLTYRAIDGLLARGWVVRKGAARGAGPTRQILSATPTGRRQNQRWLSTPVEHIRDVRTELLLKLVLCDRRGVNRGPLLAAQRRAFAPHFEALRRAARARNADDVDRWRYESSLAVRRFLERSR
jgi:PadR family transcriptional regulator AphA